MRLAVLTDSKLLVYDMTLVEGSETEYGTIPFPPHCLFSYFRDIHLNLRGQKIYFPRSFRKSVYSNLFGNVETLYEIRIKVHYIFFCKLRN